MRKWLRGIQLQNLDFRAYIFHLKLSNTDLICISRIKKDYSSSSDHLKNSFKNSHKTISLLLMKSSTNHEAKNCKSKIMGGLSPVHIKNYNGFTELLPDNSSLVFFFDENKLRKCPQTNKCAAMCSGKYNRIFAFASLPNE